MRKNNTLGEYALLAAWLLALTATLIALYASEILNMPVCTLCWYQRVFIFPLAVQLGIATFRNDTKIAIYATPLAALGGLVAIYHYLVQMIPALAPYTPCRATLTGVSCEKIDWQLGFITFPFLSALVCAMIFILLLISHWKTAERSREGRSNSAI